MAVTGAENSTSSVETIIPWVRSPPGALSINQLFSGYHCVHSVCQLPGPQSHQKPQHPFSCVLMAEITQLNGWAGIQARCVCLCGIYGVTLPRSFRRDGIPETPPKGVGYLGLFGQDGEEMGWRSQADATDISGQMKSDSFSAWFHLELENIWVQAAWGSEGQAAIASVLRVWVWRLCREHQSSSMDLLT